MDFQADSVTYWNDGGVATVFFGNEKEELALTLAQVPGTADHTCEWNDQSNVCVNAVRSLVLRGRTVRIGLLAKAAKRLGVDSFVIELHCGDEELGAVARLLPVILGSRFRMEQTAAGAVAPARPAKDYSTIKYLNLEGKDLRVLPEDIALMTALETAKLGRNPRLDFAAVCEVLSGLPRLRELSFSTDGPVPESLGMLTALESLQLTGFQGPQVLPESMGRLRKLKSILIMSDSDVILPESFAELEALESLHVRAASWQLPKRFDRLRCLQMLDLAQCRVGRAPEGMAEMAAVTCVALGDAEGCDYEQILSVVARMPNVRQLELSTNPVPAAVGLCRQIEELVIWAGVNPEQPLRLPEAMFELAELETLVMSRNCFAAIPEGLGRLRGLRSLTINESEFEALPESLGDLTELTFLNLSENPNLRVLPESLGKLRKLEVLNLSDNPGLRRLPESLAGLTALEQVDLRGTENLENVPESWAAILV